MIESIKQINNVGKFESFTSNSTFVKNNIIFGFNGAGKSTLSDIFYSLAHTGKESLITQRVTLKRNENEPNKEINIQLCDENGIHYNFRDSHWGNTPSNVFVFNNQYVKEHVFVSQKLEGDTIPIGMGTNGANYMSQRDQVKTSISNLINEMNTNISVLNSAGFKFKDVTASKITQKTNIKRYNTIAQFDLYTLGMEPAIREKLKSHTKYSTELSNIKECQELYLSITGLTPISKNEIVKAISKTPRISSKDIASYLSNTLTTTDIKWAVRGYRNQKLDTVCPLCGQTLSEKHAIQFFNKLGKYVSQNKDEKIKSTCTSLNNLAGQLSVLNIPARIDTFNEIADILSKANLLRKKDSCQLTKGLSWTPAHSGYIQNIIDKLYEKAENPYNNLYLTDNENATLSLLNQVISNINVLGKIIVECEERLNKKIDRTLSIDEMSMRCELSFGSFRTYMETLKAQAHQMIRFINKLDVLNMQIDDCYNQIQLDAVNEFLNKLNTNIKIEVHNKKYFIRLKNFIPMEYSKNYDNTIFSEGEQKAIAFAYFLAELQNFDNTNNNRIIIIDDPISSMDLCRKSIISYQIAEFMKDANTQVFILSHDISFIERITNFISSSIQYAAYELNIEKNDFLPLLISDYLTTDEKVYMEFISSAQNDHSELAKIIALMSLRPFAYVSKVTEPEMKDVIERSTYFSHTLYSHNTRLKYKPEDYSSAKLKEYINTINSITSSSFDADSIVDNYNFNGFDFNTLVDLYSQIPLNNIQDARKKVLLMRPLIEACFFQLSQRSKFDPEHIGKMYKKTERSNKSDRIKLALCKELYALYDSSKKYHHGADDGSLLGISWINPSEVDFYNSTLESIVQKILSFGTIRTISA